MALSEPSSVVFSIQELLSAESLRVQAEQAEHQAQLEQRQELKLREQANERLSTERSLAAEREHARHQQLLGEIDMAKRQWAAQNAVEMARMRRQLEQEYRLQAAEDGPRNANASGRPLILTAALITLLFGAVGSWFFVILPGEKRADKAYASLQDAYTSLLQERQLSADSWSRERQQLKLQVETLLKKANSESAKLADRQNPKFSNEKPNNPQKPPVGQRPGVTAPPCTCLRGDPLCDC